MSRITVAHAVPTWLGHTQAWLYNLVRELPDDIESHVVAYKTQNLDQFPHPHIETPRDGPLWRHFLEKALRRFDVPHAPSALLRCAREHRVRLIHSHFGNIGFGNLSAARRRRLPHVVSFYGADISYLPQQDPTWRARYHRMFRVVDRVLCEGPHMLETAAELGCPRRKLRLHRLGVNLGRVAFRPRRYTPPEPLKVLIAATFREKKGIPYAIEALGKLVDRGVKVELTLIGDSDGWAGADEKQRILTALAHPGLAKVTRQLGFVPYRQLFEEADRHHVYVAPSVTARNGDTEGGAPVAIIELAASGMPVVTTRHCDIPEIISHRETGLLADERDVPGLVAAFEWLIAHPDAWETMAEAARRHVEMTFNAETQGQALSELYREVLGKTA